MNEDILEPLRPLRGLVATVVLGGGVREEFAMCRENLRAWNILNGLTNVEYRNFPAVLVEHGRDEVFSHALAPAGGDSYDWCLQIDADATFTEDSLARILHTAYTTVPDSDVVGAYSQLKNAPYLPTIDTGTGTWEERYPGEGVLPVMRTGGHFLLVKTPILKTFGPPWFKTRRGIRPVDALREIDNFSRIHHDGKNILAGSAWDSLVSEAKAQGGGAESPVGEDSGFCDSAAFGGAKMYVDTNIVTGHIGRLTVTPDMLKEAMDARRNHVRAAVGVVT